MYDTILQLLELQHATVAEVITTAPVDREYFIRPIILRYL